MKLFSHEYDSVKASLLVGFIVLCGIFIISTGESRWHILPGLINSNDTVDLQITLDSYEGIGNVEPGIYGIGAAKMYDEMATEEDWIETATDLISDLSPTTIRYPAGGLVKYSHVFTEHMTQPLTPAEQANVVNIGFGNEIRGIGQIEADRIDEEARGNDGELSEIADPKPAYGNQSYIDGFQNLMPRNFIHDIVDISDSTNTDLLYVINMRYASPLEIADQVEYLISQGVDIQGYEFDNEVYAKGGFYYQAGSPSVKAPIAVTEYLNDADTYKAAILEVDPSAEFAVVAAPKKDFEEGGLGVEDTDSNWNSEWNIALASQMGAHGYSNYVVHFYHGFFTCLDEVTTNIREDIFSCGTTELRYFNDETSGPTDTTSIPPMLTAFHNQFAGKDLWLTEWNINQDPNRTDSKFANSVLHAALTQQFLNILNTANATYGNFIKHATYHTFATDGGNAMVNKQSGKGANIESPDIDGFVRRTPYYAFMSMKNVFNGSYKPMKTSFSSGNDQSALEDITIYGYKDASGDTALAITNLSGKTINIESITVDGKLVDLDTSSSSLYSIDGDANFSSRGSTEFGSNPGFETTIREEDYNDVASAYIPAYGVSTLSINTEYVQEEVIDTPTPDTKDPKVSISSPLNKSTVSSGIVQIQAYAIDSSGIEKVDFYMNQTLLGTDTQAPYKYSWSTVGLAPGAYNIRAVAYDTAGNSSSTQIKVAKE
jgi:hypothetical protein